MNRSRLNNYTLKIHLADVGHDQWLFLSLGGVKDEKKKKKRKRKRRRTKKMYQAGIKVNSSDFFSFFFAFIHSQCEQKQEFITYTFFSHLQPSIFHGEYAKSLSTFESNIKKNKLAELNLRRTQHMMFPGFCPLIYNK